MATSSSRRRLLPEPVETSARTSKRPHSEDPAHRESELRESALATNQSLESHPATSKPRRFLPQPLEETARSSREGRPASKDTPAANDENQRAGSSRKDLPTVATGGGVSATTTRRRFTPEPIEVSASSSRRKFTPQLLGTNERTHRATNDNEEHTSSTQARRKFRPEPVETTTSVRRRRPSSPEEDSSRSSSPVSRSASGDSRKFAPELIETARGSYRRAVITAAEHKLALAKTRSTQSSISEEDESKAESLPDVHESKFSAANLAKRGYELQKTHSFQVPSLSMIESDSDDEHSKTPSLSQSSTDSSGSLDRRLPQPPTQTESYTDYVFRLASKVTEKELQDQAMSAYINERIHEPVAHFAFDEDDDDHGAVHVGRFAGQNGASARLFRRDSAEDLRWELENQQRHHEQLEAMKQELKNSTAGQSRFSSAALLSRQKYGVGAKLRKRDSTRTRVKEMVQNGGKRQDTEDVEYQKMRTAASPPMAGDDLVFVLTVSPKMTRCETDQAPRPRTADDPDDQLAIQGEPNVSLWCSHAQVKNDAPTGLWMGMCHKTSAPPSRPITPVRSGIQTPTHDIRNPFDAPTPSAHGRATPGKRMGRPWIGGAGAHFLPLTPPRDDEFEDAFVSSIDKKLMLERQIDEEFSSKVITQIYNYLLLGYPSLARPFDDELSKISKIPIEEIRRDDDSVDAKGHVGAPETGGVDGNHVEKDGGCRRWEALRLYVREWARQSRDFRSDVNKGLGVGEEWGARARRGSWAH